MKLISLIFFSVLFFFPLYSAEYSTGEIIVKEDGGEESAPVSPFDSFKTESVSEEKFDDPFRHTLADLVQDQVGIDTQVYCANCGAKRLTINGLKGEHTSILIDGLPLHSAVSSFYGVDTVPLLGLADVKVMRGAGASLSNPEAIGGTLNLITANPLDFDTKIRTSFGVDDNLNRQSQNYNFLTGQTHPNKKIGYIIGGSFTRNETWDEDNNRVAELPQREGKSFLFKFRELIGDKSDFNIRAGYSDLEILGGASNPVRPTRVRPIEAGEADFIDGDVENLYIGDPAKITDWINLERLETALTFKHYISDETLLDFKLGHARQEQKAIYQHGFDYAHIDNMFIGDVSISHFFTDSVGLKTGLFIKDERLRSASVSLFDDNSRDIAKDNFNYSSTALYSEFSYLKEDWEMNFSVRADHIDINWLELTNRVKEWVIAPRFNLMHNISEHLTQRFSYGLGYRAPLTFFESGHGNNESGYEVNITDLEKAHSLVYSLSYNTPTGYATLGTHYTHIKNLAYGFEQPNEKILYVNSDGEYDILVNDLLVGYKPHHDWLIEGSVEFFHYQTAYKDRLQTAAIEQRLTLSSNYTSGKFNHVFTVQYVPGRNIGAYGDYSDHFRRRNQASEPILDTSLPKKDQNAPSFFQFDTHFSYQASDDLKVNFSIQNILDYTQTSAGDSPATWHWHFVHHHFDGLHTWGPNAGRQFALGLEYKF